ncbi:permease [Sulfuriferula plumbiphila]|uniref:Permease n=1 Tax=Sulfuriferula plumbiphila TaxID=171865 RepID=A0A512LA46_9PROT|nr:ABC transporter permease [Sulfuriferula plumbiphila]BBP05682.1 permease [Sulfuriferula plumbiphila]GEP31356.1 permease [Sulfuriferula plumbiphila]
MWKLALRNVLRHKARTGMTLLAIIAGVVGLILSGGFVHDIFTQLGEALIHSQSGHVQLSRTGYFEHGARSPEKYLITEPEPIRKEIAAMAGVDDVMGRVYFAGLLNNGRSDLPIVGEGVEASREARLGSGMVISAGRRLEDKDEHGMMVGYGVAHALKLKPGDWATLVMNTADGALNSLDFQVVGVFQTFSRDYDARAVRIPLAAAQDLLATHGVNTLVISLKQTRETESMATALKKYIGPGLEVKTWLELNDFYAKTVKMYDVQFGVLRLIILLMVLLSVVNSVNMSVYERVGEFGTMMALGNRSRKVFALIIAENTIIGLAGATAGVVLGIVLALIISAIGIPMPPPPNANLSYIAHIRVVPAVVAGAFAVGLIATIVAALLPAARVHRIPVVDALRQNV